MRHDKWIAHITEHVWMLHGGKGKWQEEEYPTEAILVDFLIENGPLSLPEPWEGMRWEGRLVLELEADINGETHTVPLLFSSHEAFADFQQQNPPVNPESPTHTKANQSLSGTTRKRFTPYKDPSLPKYKLSLYGKTRSQGLEEVYQEWDKTYRDSKESSEILQTALTPLIRFWQQRKENLKTAHVSATKGGFVKNPVTFTHVALAGWEEAGGLPAAFVDGEPMATHLPDLAAQIAYQQRGMKRRQYKPRKSGSQLNFPAFPDGVHEPPRDMRLIALQGLPAHVAADVLTLLQVAHAVQWPGVLLLDREGARLLARTRDGGYRRPLPGDIERYRQALWHLPGPLLFRDKRGLVDWRELSPAAIVLLLDREGARLLARTRDGGYRRPLPGDIERYRQALWHLPGPLLFRDKRGLVDWRELASVATQPDGRRRIAPPEWLRSGFQGERWTLSAAGSYTARARTILEADCSPAGRLITALEYRLATRYQGGTNPDLQAAYPGGPGLPVFVSWREVMRLAGYVWDSTDKREDQNMLMTYHRAIDRMKEAGYFLTSLAAGGEAKAGDAIEVVERIRAARARPAGIKLRASSRFVQARKEIERGEGKGFELISLPDWLGLK